MDWKIGGWELGPGIYCVIREKNLHTGKYKEKVYQSPNAARKYLEKRMESGEPIEFTMVDSDTVHLLKPHEDDYDDTFIY